MTQCTVCGRDAVPKAYVSDSGELYCESCFDPDEHTDEHAQAVEVDGHEPFVGFLQKAMASDGEPREEE